MMVYVSCILTEISGSNHWAHCRRFVEPLSPRFAIVDRAVPETSALDSQRGGKVVTAAAEGKFEVDESRALREDIHSIL